MQPILGIDPGLAHVGWGLITHDGIRSRYLAHGVIKTDSKSPMADRLLHIYDGLAKVIEEYKPGSAGIETLYFAKNVSSAMPVAEARGALLLCMARHNLVIGEYTPLQIKQSVVGNGRAEKHQVQVMVALLLKLKEPPKPDHAADALAAALCHAHTGGLT
ncbi:MULTISPECIES: crossover junction endodeoxyribonuclease RuvC [unclassified Oceanispirochaeta]|uniref:crossover junction endodeoxyribonuclease RuvC n=1 Tax=unclassified Oceanispirochaeta TaxID=2635722 RepID=UPI000E09AA08|nr:MULTISPECIES: crossover junction endodeoxyribonuclease RuvC [unclassified Oceanispirochaeta]MBF9015158.1 crossover junction endodeoxyribonuclease RuvC [Oceanispirochaeta sp. M2]NPD71616.1 crossover junction endodeoxyribonuclease RuvC [Oceanispirochaeta sp. M1]RDG33183.1 crossover junction endodeoxyribonuclease RuvC [Oceanispirochaeta sp. M1]